MNEATFTVGVILFSVDIIYTFQSRNKSHNLCNRKEIYITGCYFKLSLSKVTLESEFYAHMLVDPRQNATTKTIHMNSILNILTKT